MNRLSDMNRSLLKLGPLRIVVTNYMTEKSVNLLIVAVEITEAWYKKKAKKYKLGF